MSVFIMRFRIFLFFYLLFSVEVMAINWDKRIKFKTKGLIFGHQIPLKIGADVYIVDSKKHPNWNNKKGVICRGLNKNQEYFVVLKNENGRLSSDEEKRGWITWRDVCSYEEREVEHKTLKEAEEYALYIFLYQTNRKYCGYCRIPRESILPRKLKGCSGCADIKKEYRIRYCSRRCQKKDWKRHKEICRRKGKEEYI